MFLFLKKFCNIKYVLLAFFILFCNCVRGLLSALSIAPKYLKFSTLMFILNFPKCMTTIMVNAEGLQG